MDGLTQQKILGVSLIVLLLIFPVYSFEEKGEEIDSLQESGNWSSYEGLDADFDPLKVISTDNETIPEIVITANETYLDTYDDDDNEYYYEDLEESDYRHSAIAPEEEVIPTVWEDEEEGVFLDPSTKDVVEPDDEEDVPDCEQEHPKPVERKKKTSNKRRKDDKFYYNHKKYGKKQSKKGKSQKKQKMQKNWKKNCCIRGKRVGNNRRTFMSEDLTIECQERARNLASRMSKHCRWIFWSCCEARALRKYYIHHKAGRLNNC